MIQLKTPISKVLADQLEEYFCEEGSDHWMIESIPGGRDYHLYGFFQTTEEAQDGLQKLRIHFAEIPEAPDLSVLPDQNWQEAYKEHFQPWNSGNLHWVPVWMREEYIVPEGHKALYLDPGMAFGTGNHETTRLCIEALLKYTQEPSPDELATKRIIDAGCGSGILSLSAALLGYQHISAFDIDEDSIRISQENAALNNLENEVQFSTASLNTAIPKQSCDIILANILAPVLMKNATILLEGLMPAKGSILVLSGILKKEADAVASTFLDHARHFSYNLEIIQQDDGIWSALCCRLL